MTLACLPFLLQLLGTVARKNSSSQSAAIGAAHEMNLRQITDGTNGPLALNKAKFLIDQDYHYQKTEIS